MNKTFLTFLIHLNHSQTAVDHLIAKQIHIHIIIAVLFTIVSSIGYVVLSGNIHVDRHETTLSTLFSCAANKTLSFIRIFFRCKRPNWKIHYKIHFDKFCQWNLPRSPNCWPYYEIVHRPLQLNESLDLVYTFRTVSESLLSFCKNSNQFSSFQIKTC